jgi:hypothetical protein
MRNSVFEMEKDDEPERRVHSDFILNSKQTKSSLKPRIQRPA